LGQSVIPAYILAGELRRHRLRGGHLLIAGDDGVIYRFDRFADNRTPIRAGDGTIDAIDQHGGRRAAASADGRIDASEAMVGWSECSTKGVEDLYRIALGPQYDIALGAAGTIVERHHGGDDAPARFADESERPAERSRRRVERRKRRCEVGGDADSGATSGRPSGRRSDSSAGASGGRRRSRRTTRQRSGSGSHAGRGHPSIRPTPPDCGTVPRRYQKCTLSVYCIG
jgi:hypothetical protein